MPDLDYTVPFAGISENGQEIDGLDDRPELAHCMMLVNLLRIFGETAACTPESTISLDTISNDGPRNVGVNTEIRDSSASRVSGIFL
jgi:hypothetical protein